MKMNIFEVFFLYIVKVPWETSKLGNLFWS